ncbi:CaiB/BaiF CoA transferase family protein [Sphingomonas flavalba]|uniref:CaiB/BaiF CoA transferase family protein n=1 Tax=Sphingomonas flavalba TaxID=2559804 RepID=UPI0039DFA3DE
MSGDAQAEGGQTPRPVLDGVRVLDFGKYVAGPYCAAILADFGAEVIRIERPGGGDDRTVVPVTANGEGALFAQMNRNKASMCLDQRQADATEVVRRLVGTADVVIANVPEPMLVELGLDYATLSAIKPDIILVNASSFGAEGPWAGRGGFDSVGQAMCGSTYLSGDEARHYRTPITWVDHATALYAAIGVMMALLERRESGRGQQVGASLLGSALSFSATYLIEEAMIGIGRKAIGNRSFVNGPTDLFACRDGEIVTQVVGDGLFRRWTRLIGEPHWLDDPRFATDASRGEHGAILSERMAAWCAERDCAGALEALARAGIPAGPVLSPSAALTHPQVAASGLIEPVALEGGAPSMPLVNLPVRLSRTPSRIVSPPPASGADSVRILTSLGFTAAQVRDLAGRGVI